MNGHERISVLVAAHDRWTRSSLAVMLDDAGMSVTEASNGATALRRALSDAPHVVILGHELPEMCAAELTYGLRADPRTRRTAIVGVRAGVDADASLQLPCRPVDLLASVVDALESRRQVLAAEPMRSVIASPRGTWPLVEGSSSRSTSRMRNGGRSGKWRFSNAIDTL